MLDGDDLKTSIRLEANLLQSIAQIPLAGVVHSVFYNIINCRQLDTSRFFCLASAKVDVAYDCITTDLPTLEMLEAQTGQTVYVCTEYIQLADQKIQVAGINPIRLQLPTFPTESSIVAENITLAQKYLEQHGKRGGMLTKRGNGSAFSHMLEQQLQIGMQRLEAALIRRDQQIFLAYAEQLLGLGIGLTPAGDDYLSGLMHVMNLPDSPLVSMRSAARRLAQEAENCTNAISAWELRHAAWGRARQGVCHLFDALFGQGAIPLSEALDFVLSVGSTSGTDLTIGILSGLSICISQR